MAHPSSRPDERPRPSVSTPAEAETLAQSILEQIAEIKAISPSQVGITLSAGNADFPAILGDFDAWWRIYRAGILIATNGLCSLSTVMTGSIVQPRSLAIDSCSEPPSTPIA